MYSERKFATEARKEKMDMRNETVKVLSRHGRCRQLLGVDDVLLAHAPEETGTYLVLQRKDIK